MRRDLPLKSRVQTAADYGAIAVAPLLIFLMIGSLANFLVVMLYPGPYPDRVAWIVWCFTMGTVALARVAIEQSRSYSLGYAVALGLASFVVMAKFFGAPLLSAFILLVIGTLADRIVHDCTIIDDSKDASGWGLFGPRRHRSGKQPGRTVLYLALAALPLFGLGQLAIQDPSSTERATWYLAIYLFASLSLLVTTSFLGLRRYLRQRGAEMPTNVTVGWLAGGLLLVAGLLTVAFLTPLPGQTLASIELPEFLSPPDEMAASRFGWGNEGAEPGDDQTTQGATTTDADAEDATSQSSSASGQSSEEGASDEASASGPSNQSGQESQSSQDGESSSGDRQGGNSENSGKEGESDQGQPSGEAEASGEAEPSSGTQTSSGTETSSGAETSDASESSSESEPAGGTQDTPPPGDTSRPDESSSASEETEQERGGSDGEGATGDSDGSVDDGDDRGQSGPPPSQSPLSPSRLLSGLADWFRVILVLALVAIVATYVWFHRDQIARWWSDLWGRRSADSEPDAGTDHRGEEPAPPRPFSSFRNPIGREKDPRRVIVVTFQAFEAWTRERGWQRGREETPSEFAGRVAAQLPESSDSASRVIDAYNRIVYGRGAASSRDVAAAERIWSTMQSGNRL